MRGEGPLATLKDVARLAGVSITTVSHALNGTRFVQPETAARVFSAVSALGYSPNSIARGLRTGASRTIGVIGPSAQDPFFAEVVVGIEETAYARGYEVYLGFVEYPSGEVCGEDCGEPVAEFTEEQAFLKTVLGGRFDAPAPCEPEDMVGGEKEEGLIAKLLAREVDGLIMNLGQPDAVVAKILAGTRPKVALFHRAVAGVDADVFAGDDYGGCLLALRALRSLGHTRIGMVYGFSWQSHVVRERYRAYRDSLVESGTALDTTILLNGGYTFEGAAQATRTLLAMPQRPTAILYWSDLMAISGMDAARQAGFSVPGDVSIVGFDDLPISGLVYPRLSSISQQKYEAGVAMTARLIDRIEGKLDGPSVRVISPTTYVARASVAAALAKTR
jgi:LacI family transcriptional regulator